MADTNPSIATVSDMTNNVPDYAVAAMQTDGVGDQKETEYMWTNWTKYYGYYRQIPELKKAIDAFATWAVGKGFTTKDVNAQVALNHITGWGEDTFNSIMWNMTIIKKINGDAFAEIIRDKATGKMVNLKPLDPGNMKVVVNRQGIIQRYEQVNKIGKADDLRKFNPQDIFHICNDRVADEIHGISVVESVEEVILNRNEAMEDFKTVLHRNVVPLTIVEVDINDQSKLDVLVKKYENLIKNKEVIFVPKGNVEIKRDGLSGNATMNPLPWIEYNEDFFYKAVGVPAIILGGSKEFTEATAKISYLTFEQIYTREQKELEADILNQLGWEITINKPASLQNELLSDEAKDQGTMEAAPKDEMGVRMGQE